MLYVLNPYKGLCLSSEKCPKMGPIYSDGLDQFDWLLALPEVEITTPSAELAVELPKKKGKEVRKERKELRKLRKASQLAAVSHAKSSRDGNILSPPSDEEFNPYVVKKRIKDLHLQIIRSAKGEGDTKLFKCGLVDIYKLDVLYLLPEEWLNDNNISFMYEMIVTHFLKEHDFGFHIQLLFPAITQLILHFPIEEDLQSILPMKDLAKLRVIFLPFNFIDENDYADLENANNGDHWALCVLSMVEKKLFVYDSMAMDGEDDALLHKLAQRLQKTLFKPNEKITIVKMKCDQQQNFDDCGVFLIMFSCFLIAQLVSGEPTDLSVAHVRFNPLLARLKIMEIVYKLSQENNGQLENQNKAFS